jgi:hypothetical protein
MIRMKSCFLLFIKHINLTKRKLKLIIFFFKTKQKFILEEEEKNKVL